MGGGVAGELTFHANLNLEEAGMGSRFPSTASVILLIAAHLHAFGGTVRVVKNDPLVAAAIGDSSDTIFISGDIDADLINTFITEIDKNRVTVGTVYIDSPGGNLFAGMQLGREIRKRGLDTDVGQQSAGPEGAGPGVCYSAAVLTFLGGRYRYCRTDSKIGVHRFFSTEKTPNGLDLAQVVSASIVDYLRDMGIDAALLDRMARVGRDDVLVLSVQDMEALNVINNGVLPSQWTLEVIPTQIYLKGEQTTRLGTGKILMFLQPDEGLMILAMYEGGENIQMIAATKKYSLRIDDDFLPIEQVLTAPRISNGYVSVSFKPTDAQIKRLLTAKKIGFAFRPPNSSIFYGFTIDVSEPRDKLINFLAYCSHSALLGAHASKPLIPSKPASAH